MRVVIVGAGAVGQVFGHHLAMGGAEVWFLVRPEQAEAARRGFVLYDLRRSKRPPPVPFRPAGILTTTAAVAGKSWDQAWLAISSPALRGPWLPPFLSTLGNATLVNLAPGFDDPDYLSSRFPATRTIQGVISFIAWQTPLHTESRPEPGIACWIPPLSACLFDGPPETEAALTTLVTTLSRGGCPARHQRDAAHLGALASAAMLPIIHGIELEGWSLPRFARSPRARLAAEAAREALTVVMRASGRKSAWGRHLVQAPLVGTALSLAPHLVPFDLEVYLQHHFTKVGGQTRQILGEYVTAGRSLGCPVRALQALSL